MTDTSARASPEPQISADLVRRIGLADQGAEQAMFRRYSRGLLYLIRRRAGDVELAQDICQETFRIAIEKLRAEPLDDPERLAAYLRGVALNLVAANWRTSGRRATTPDSEAIEAMWDDRPGPFDNVSGEQIQLAVRALLAELPVQRDREILTRLYLREQDRETICAALGVDATHFNRVLFRAKQRFKALLVRAERKQRLRLVR